MPVTSTIDPAFSVGLVNPWLFGTFVEHLGRCVYTGIYEPTHPSADEDGFRGDVAALVRELGATVVRYPGGNFVSNYRWEDGVGPRASRPRVFDLAWRSIETNQVGTDDFLAWCTRVGLEPMLAVNLGNRGLAEAVDYLEYVNGAPGTRYADQRVGNGHVKPWGVRLWCLGNEMDGPWQIGHKTPVEYARLAQEVAHAYKTFDPDLQLVACGSSNPAMPTFGDWERIVLEHCFDDVDLISAHVYYEPIGGDDVSFLAVSAHMDRYIRDVVSTADHVAAKRHSQKRINISFDEWNVWFAARHAEKEVEQTAEVTEAPALIQDVYTALDAVVVGSLLITLLRHTDRVGVACQAQLVNAIAPILTVPGGAAWRQTIFHPFALTAKYARGTVLMLGGDHGQVDTPAHGAVEQVWAVATHDAQSGELAIFAANRSLADPASWTVRLGAFGELRLVEHLVVGDEDHSAVNSEDFPDRVVPKAGVSALAGDQLSVTLPPASWHCIRLASR
ncbi:alpha-N-arabinofuranosidase [Actinopolymorpha singaporensis]|uniref:non-reducing end alpha-L-arabinofuranosidase n=1 Tax=Actinopolymorpha singaporensis TaxID=117157 RepID=A0A1H1MSB3_9ACTN|nr:alpha-N-arabinofuranosidase [Actinopolymorpha singaporensis]SDR89596.1 alpha-N-arabinofuranosidase [Actinopolymorpha singaporensis]